MESIVNILVVPFYSQSSSNLVRMLVYVIARMSSNMGHLRLKTRSQEVKIEKSCVHSSGSIFGSIIFKLGKDACLGNSSDKFEHSASWMKN
jgi:hypothetical protein